ncbi:MAG: hypothetical protein RLP02_11300, partial [Coleofasciculus sp. C2-GNP5-27]
SRDRTLFPNLITPRSHPICSTQSTRDRTLSPQPNPNANRTLFPSTSPKRDRTFSLQLHPNAIALSSLQPNPNAIALPPLNPTQTRSHSLPFNFTQTAIASLLFNPITPANSLVAVNGEICHGSWSPQRSGGTKHLSNYDREQYML